MVFRGIFCFPVGKVKQNISHNAEDGQPHQGMSDASCTFAVTHGGREPGRFSLFALQLSDGQSEASVPVCEESKSSSQPIPVPLKYSESLVSGWPRYFAFIGPDCRLPLGWGEWGEGPALQLQSRRQAKPG